MQNLSCSKLQHEGLLLPHKPVLLTHCSALTSLTCLECTGYNREVCTASYSISASVKSYHQHSLSHKTLADKQSIYRTCLQLWNGGAERPYWNHKIKTVAVQSPMLACDLSSLATVQKFSLQCNFKFLKGKWTLFPARLVSRDWSWNGSLLR